MLEQTVEEVAEAMHDNPEAWAQQYLDLIYMLEDLQQKHSRLALAVLPAEGLKH